MSAPKSYLPMLNGLVLGDAISSHDGVSCYPAIRQINQEKYIVKVISVPASQVQLDAMLLTGAFPNKEAALEYYMDISRDILREAEILRQLSHHEGFLPYLDAQIIENDDLSGYDIYLLSNFRKTLAQIFETDVLTHKQIIHLSLDLCASLAACRREGYLYIDLKPENIFCLKDQGFRIGDVGFAALSSLSYSSLPEKYRSPYTAPELLHEMSIINDTVDVYSIGLIMYQAYNGSIFPDIRADQPLPAPQYADYEFAEIILKACDPDVRKRWADPTQLGQAIIDYLKRNTVLDEPIIPSVQAPISDDASEIEDFLPEMEPDELLREIDALAGTEYEEFTVLAKLSQADSNDEIIEDIAISEELDEMLAQADALIAHELPEPPVAPLPVDVPMPERIEYDLPTQEDYLSEDAAPAEPLSEEIDESKESEQPEEILPIKNEITKPAQPTVSNRMNFPWKIVASVLLITAMICLIIGGYYFYNTQYLQQIDAMTLAVNGDTLSVKVSTTTDINALTVICSDSYGNTMRKNLSAGIAIFTGLAPQTHYTIHLEIQGFHKLIGHISDSFTTDPQTNISNLTAGIGNEDGSVLIRFDTDDPRNVNWIISYSSEDTQTQQITFQGNAVQITQLQIGKEYTFTLSRADSQILSGNTQIKFTPSQLLYAQDLAITSCGNGKLIVQWSAPDNMTDILWNVRCHNASGFDQTIITSELTAAFTDLEHNVACTVEVTADGMPQGISTTIEANPITVEQFHFVITDDGMLEVSWDYSGIVYNGWILEYSISNTALQSITLADNTVKLLLIPGGRYTISVSAIDATQQFGGNCNFTWAEAECFQQWGISAELLSGMLCILPNIDEWNASEIPEDQFTCSLTASQKVGVVFRSETAAEPTEEMIKVRFIFYSADGTLLYVAELDVIWNEIWTGSICGLDLPWLPQEAGEYVTDVYFDGKYVSTLSFSILENE